MRQCACWRREYMSRQMISVAGLQTTHAFTQASCCACGVISAPLLYLSSSCTQSYPGSESAHIVPDQVR